MGCFARLSRLFGVLVALRMTERQVTPSQLTQQVPAVNRFTLGRILRGTPPHDPRLSTMCAIADALDVELPALLGSQEGSVTLPQLSRRTIEIVTLVTALPPVWQDAIAAGLRELGRELDTGPRPSPPQYPVV